MLYHSPGTDGQVEPFGKTAFSHVTRVFEYGLEASAAHGGGYGGGGGGGSVRDGGSGRRHDGAA